jgi:hypothetical protein
MKDLAAEHGVALEDLVRTPLYGSTAPDAPFFARFQWDIHHENPVTTADDLGRRSVIEPPPPRPPVGLEAVASLAPGGSIEFNPPVPALELAELLGVEAPVARTVGIYMDRWEVSLGTAVAILDGGATGETYGLPAARGARVVASDRVRYLRR